jgi:SAM-dependent methyltransferase|tara:strand:- start:682 stop:1443 length:762 start_codon:yes stop_codon:yes gene_type:complete
MKQGPRDHTYDLNLLSDSLSAWERSPGLRCVYADIYREIALSCIEGPILEVGSGIAVSRGFFTHLVTSDIVKTAYVDCAMSAYDLEPRADGLWPNIFAVDVLHHLKQPMRFFESAASVLRPGGRLILTEPAATFGGRLFYSLFHHEPTCPHLIRAPYEFKSNTEDGGFANMGMGVGLFRDHRPMLDEQLAMMGLRCVEVKFRDVFAYPLTGGYSKPQLLPTIALRALLKLEKYLPQFVYRWFGLRMMITLEKI